MKTNSCCHSRLRWSPCCVCVCFGSGKLLRPKTLHAGTSRLRSGTTSFLRWVLSLVAGDGATDVVSKGKRISKKTTNSLLRT